ncbi:MAG TPA: preprotein translocase subunit SecE [Planctomycetota bacterium]|jgi:preprotein translocase SecE subunit|nr:preprotein translocase subunit SecE [Planctomycetota bacterium]
MPETMDEKQTRPEPAPSPSPASKAANFRLMAKIWVALMGAAWAATVAHLLTQLGWLGSAGVQVGHITLSAGGLAVGGAVGVGLVVGILKKMGDKLDYAKPGQGRAVRTTAYVGIAALSAYGAYALYMAPGLQSLWWRVVVGPLSLMGKEANLRPQLFPAVAVFLTVMFVVFQVLNQDKTAEFLIETEGEIKKVSWPARKEYVGSAMIVVLVVAIVSGFLHWVDHGLSMLMQALGVGF